jgi:hypothetical protein
MYLGDYSGQFPSIHYTIEHNQGCVPHDRCQLVGEQSLLKCRTGHRRSTAAMHGKSGYWQSTMIGAKENP